MYDEEGRMCNSEKQQLEELTKHFKNIFEKENQEQPPQYPPCQNNPPFTKEEIITATRRLKNEKSPGVDEMIAELLKLAPDKVHQIIADVLNTSVETDNYLEILKVGILSPLQKPSKKNMKIKQCNTYYSCVSYKENPCNVSLTCHYSDEKR